VTGAVVKIASDESGFSGSNLLHPATPVITHASVDLCTGEAVELITALRSRFRFSPNEFKSGQFLRNPAAGEALEWLLAALRGRAHVHLVDKEYFLITRIVDLLLAEPSYAAGTRLTQDQRPAALTLYRARHLAGSDWRVFLAAFVDLVRVKRRHRPDPLALERKIIGREDVARFPVGRLRMVKAAGRDRRARSADMGGLAAAGMRLATRSERSLWTYGQCGPRARGGGRSPGVSFSRRA